MDENVMILESAEKIPIVIPLNLAFACSSRLLGLKREMSR